MTMNIMSVSVPSSAELGGSAMGKAADGANGGQFAEVFSQESANQASSASSQSSSGTSHGAAADKPANDSPVQDSPVQDKSATGSADLKLVDEQDDADPKLGATDPAAQDTRTQTDTKAPSVTQLEDEAEPEILLATGTPPAFAVLNLAPQLEPVDALAPAEAKASNSAIRPDAEATDETDAKRETSQRQGGSALPPKFAAALGDTVDPDQLAGEPSDKAKSRDQAASPALDKTRASELEAKTSPATTQPPLNATVSGAARAIEPANAAVLLASTADAREAVTELTKGEAKAAGAYSSVSFSGLPSAQALTGAAPLAAAASVVSTQTSPSGEPAAAILAESAEVKVQAQVSEQDTKAEQSTRSSQLAPDALARSAAPEWLAQIEHGKRWSQGATKADSAPEALTLVSAALGDKPGAAQAAKAINAALTKSEVTPSESVTTLATNANASGLGGLDAQQTSGQEASGLLLNREQPLLAATPERTAMLDKALTLHGSAEQNAKQLAQQAQVVVSQNLQEADIKLNPSEFGAMRIQVRMELGEVQVQFVASHPQARELLEQAMPRLREMLQQQGMNLHQGGQQSSSQQQAGQGQQQSGQQANAGSLSQGFGQGANGQGEAGQSGQQASEQQAGSNGADFQWRSYSANGDEVQEQGRDHALRTLDGTDGAKIDFFA